ncbi:MBL fold metallo-hydrolase [Neisseria sp.]|uniref:MBL fold metallo-hydrolase n=1 Tax=Neisseria sp. TaxID=192066 RepID=UPI0026DB6440|nr:MBL fold metallo-hydrolase [Neisseria sp.]MDO4228043.1 MBL fold metallo-hydrolase [Neisseria sp.]
MKRLKKFLLALLAPIVLLAAGVSAFLQWHPVFGGKPDAASLAKIRKSPHFNGKTFENLEPTQLSTAAPDAEPFSITDWAVSMINPPPGRFPARPLPSEFRGFASDVLKNNHFAWLGHATVLMNMEGKTILTDPVFHRASPLSFFGGKPFDMTHNFTADDMPALDAVLISHDHYDHLDYRAIQALNAKTKHFYVPLGVKAHLQRWGVAEGKITELDWHEHAGLGSLKFTLVPARHFSGRRLNGREETLWGAWVITSPGLNVLFGADSGYGKHFADIGRRYGGFDLVMLDNGAYDKGWAQIHMMPEQVARAGEDLNAETVMPIHWAKFDLGLHHWKDPIERFTRATRGKPYRTATPKLGEVFGLDRPPTDKWWENLQ